jgi:putative heme-binding domain-containing protein
MQPRSARILLSILLLAVPALADDPPQSESPLVRLLKSGRIPEDRQPQIIAKIGQLGSADDLRFLFDKVLADDGFAPAVRVKTLDALAEAALTRKGLKPSGSVAAVSRMMAPAIPASVRLAAIRLVGTWKEKRAIGDLASIAGDDATDIATRAAAFEALGAMGEPAAEVLSARSLDSKPKAIRLMAASALARVDPIAAAPRAANLIHSAEAGQDLAPLIAPFLARSDGAATLARSIGEMKIPTDNAKLALRAVYTLGRADAPLVAALSKAAGIENETRPPTKEEMDKLVADVASKGNAERGERIFRRPDLSCIKCHAIAGAGGGVGPDLSSVGLSAPVDYVINSILLPDQAIKEQYHTLVIATNDGQVFHGIVADKDESKVVLKQATGDLKTVPTSEIDESKEGGSLMPKGLANLMTRDEFLDLVRFISELGKPGPYAIHATPTIQRWRLMKPVPEDLREFLDHGAFVAKIRDSDPSVWVPAYGLSTGEIPVEEFTQLAGSRVLYLRGEIDVSSAGEIEVDLGSTHGMSLWLEGSDGPPVGRKRIWNATPGKHTITIRIDTTATKLAGVVVTLAKAPGSSAEFTIVGGR